MEKEQRNLRNAVVKARRLLEAEYADQLEGLYNILPSGTILDGGPGDPIARGQLLELIAHYRAGSASAKDAVERVMRELAFTTLNRFAALKMAERRGLVRECVSQGLQSAGIRELADCAPGLKGACEDGGYRLLLEAVMDEISLDLQVLFDRRTPIGLLWPRPQALEELLEILNASDLADLWEADETIGWIYQYFNADDVKKMRDESAAPRNSRELAVRNQFFTPRYVVEFLTDNTLGRLWYEMTRGKTALRERCRYLVRRPTEIFLKAGEPVPDTASGSQAEAAENLSQEELLRQPVHVPHRPLKDPREIRLLDPACGSMHFGLYAFDLFIIIYDEAWEIADGPDDAAKAAEAFASFVTLATTFPDKAAFLREVPRLIIERNIHGIDIDLRAAQIAGLSLWLRSLRAWQEAGVKPTDRPRITRSNLVCAEPMPGERELLREFVEQQLPAGERPAFTFLLEKIFDRMTLAGEAGSLLRIEEEIRTVIADAKRLWKQGPRHEQASLFPEFSEKGGQRELPLDLSGITDEQFWERVEQRIYDALEAYAKQAESGGRFQRRLFADDAAQGFAFIDLCRKAYDVVVMNPPFGEAAISTKTHFKKAYSHSFADVFQAFVERMLTMLTEGGREGVLSARTGFFLGDSKGWRKNVVFQNRVVAFADLGLGVLDDALVEVASYVLERQNPDGNLIFTSRQLNTREKEAGLLADIVCEKNHTYFRQALIEIIPDYTFAYWAPEPFLQRYREITSFSKVVGRVSQGTATADDFRFVRLVWEVDSSSIGQSNRWPPFSKGGEYSPFVDDIHLVVDWGRDGAQMKAYVCQQYPYLNGNWSFVVKNSDKYFKSGVSYPRRTASAFAARVLPAGCIFSDLSQTWFAESPELNLLTVGYFSSRVVQSFLELGVGGGDISTSGSAARRYTTAVVESIPAGALERLLTPRNLESLRKVHRFRANQLSRDEASLSFRQFNLVFSSSSLRDQAATDVLDQLAEAVAALEESARFDDSVFSAFDLSPTEVAFIESEIGVHPATYDSEPYGPEVSRLFHLTDETLISEAIAKHGSKRWFTKKSYFVERKLEIICHLLGVSPARVVSALQTQRVEVGAKPLVRAAMSEALGFVFGRWDIRYATGERPAPELPDPFAPPPVCPPGMLQGDDNLPVSPDAGRRLRAEGRYPLDVAWDGILVDDREHLLDLERRVRTALAVLWSDRADALEHEACALLGVPTLREWFRRPAGFFADHLKRYSKSRRKAPIYWPLSTPSGSYAVWVYYPRLSHDTLYRILTEFVEPKLAQVDSEIAQLERERSATDGRHGAKLAKEISDLVELQAELRAMRDELRRVAELPYRPNLNDGVQISAAPLWKLFQHTPWRKVLEQTWKDLQAERYEWAHLAYAIWPERVRAKCRTDKSLAIAHNLEDLYEEKPLPPKARKASRSRKTSPTHTSSTLPDLLSESEGD